MRLELVNILGRLAYAVLEGSTRFTFRGVALGPSIRVLITYRMLVPSSRRPKESISLLTSLFRSIRLILIISINLPMKDVKSKAQEAIQSLRNLGPRSLVPLLTPFVSP